MNRRNFISLASGLLVPWQPERVYSFLPAWRLVHRKFAESLCFSRGVVIVPDCLPGYASTGNASAPPRTQTWDLHPSDLLDLQKSADAYGYPRPVIL